MARSMYQDLYNYEDSHWWFVGRRRIVFSILNKYLPVVNSQLRLLDVGCGTGANLTRLEKYGHATGVDISEEAIKFCQFRSCKDVFQIGKGSLPFDDNTFDVVTVLDVIEHIDDDYAALCEYYRVTKENGILLITVPAYNFLWGPHDVISRHKRRYVATELKDKVQGVGFAIEKITYFETFLFPFVFLSLMKEKLIENITGKSTCAIWVRDHTYLVNKLLGFIFSLEARFLERFDFRYGVLLLCVARKFNTKQF